MIDFPVYFDNAASTFPKPENVLRAVNRLQTRGEADTVFLLKRQNEFLKHARSFPNILDANLKMLYSPKMRRNR